MKKCQSQAIPLSVSFTSSLVFLMEKYDGKGVDNILRHKYNTSIHIINWIKFSIHDALCAKKYAWDRICSSD